jgi:hypothetical protein
LFDPENHHVFRMILADYALRIDGKQVFSYSTPLPPNMIVNGLLAIGAAGISSTCCSSGGAGGGNLGRMLPARLCGQTSTTGRTRRLRSGYGLIAALIAVVCVEALTTVGTKLSATLVSIAGGLLITLPTQKKQSLTGRPQGHIVTAADFVSGSGFGGDGCPERGRNSSR